MKTKVLLTIALAIVIIVFVLFSLNWRTKETSDQVSYTQTSKVQTDIVDKQTDRMMSANSQTGNLMATGDKPVYGTSTAPSEYIPSGVKTTPEEVTTLKLDRTYSVKGGEFFGCKNVFLLRRLLRYETSGDDKAFKMLLDKSIAKENCFQFSRGEALKLLEISSDSKEIKVVRFSDSTPLWTTSESLR
jgi:hypothetical protein